MLAPTVIVSVLATTLMGGANAAPSNATNVTTPMDVPVPDRIDCRIPGFLNAGINAINDGIHYLDGIKGNATLGHQTGGGWCWRYSCSYRSGIYGCNDAQKDVQVPWTAIGYYANQIANDCTFSGNNGKVVQGQAFSPDGWNVIVGLASGTDC